MLKKHFIYALVIPPLELAVAGSGFTSNFLPATCPCDEKVLVPHDGKCVRMTNGLTMEATYTPLLPLPQLPLSACKCDVFLELQQPLLSLGQFCNTVFTTTFNSETVQLTKDGISKL